MTLTSFAAPVRLVQAKLLKMASVFERGENLLTTLCIYIYIIVLQS